MKCPNCGKWNQASLPHCIYCGQELPNDAYGPQGVPAWQLELEDRDRKNTYVRVDETGEQETTNDPRDTLASEMADLKSRKIMGEQKQRMLREEAARRGMAPSGRSVRTTSNRGTFFSAYDDPDTALRPVAPELVEEGEVAPDARRVVPVKYRTTYSSSQPEDEVYGYGNTRRIVNIQHPDESETVYDGYHDTSAYLPSFANQDEYENSMRLKNAALSRKPRRHSGRRILRFLVLLGMLGVAGWLAVAFVIPMLTADQNVDERTAVVIPTIRDDMAAHTVTIPGEDGQRITIRELRTSAIVTGGVATFDILDHVWYDNYEDYLQDTMTVTLTPYVITDSGKQQALEPIHYEIDIPLSPIELSTPDSPYQVVSTALYNIVFYVREGSTVTINGEDYARAKRFAAGRVALVSGVGVDLARFRGPVDRAAVRAGLSIGPEDAVLITVGEHSERKNHETVIAAAAPIEGAHVLFCGVGDRQAALEKQARELDMEGRVHFLGFRKDIPALLAASDVFVFPSLQEGLPVAQMEAMAAGLPCVVSDVRGNNDLIAPGEGGFLRAPRDVSGFTQDIARLLADPALRARMGERNRREMRRYSLEAVLAQMTALYRGLLDGREP